MLRTPRLQRLQLALKGLKAVAHPVTVPDVFSLFFNLQHLHQVLQNPQVVEWMNLAGDALRQRTNLRPPQRIVGKQRGCWVLFIKVLDDGHGLRQPLAIHLKHWHQLLGRYGRIFALLVLAFGNLHRNIVIAQAFEFKRNSHAKRGAGAKIAVELHA